MYKLFGKRLLDIFIVFVAVLCLSPFMIIVALLIKIIDPGPIIFKQNRAGKNGDSFSFFKFRSMPVNTGDLASDKVGQVKLTWVGKMIRRTNIDELPQLLNILKGDMSIVGPRPPLATQKELLQIRKDNDSLFVRPGLTGLAQVNSFDGMTVSEKADFDGEYIKDISFFNDVKIILNTVLYLFKPPPVY
jgi:O-antigen biosynthesis protein WbqP